MTSLFGIIPPMTTPFDEAGEFQPDKVAAQVNWMIARAAHGLAAGGSTGEGHTLDHDEYRALIAATSEAVAGRIPVIAGVITDSTREAIKRGKAVRDMNVAALQVTPVHYLFRPTDDAMVDHFRAMADETGVPIIIYNVVPWTYLSPALLCRIFDEVPNVIGVKQSAGDLKLLADLLIDAPPDRRIFTAVDALMYSSFALGAHGAIAAILSAVPHASVELWNAVNVMGNRKRPATCMRKCCGSGTLCSPTTCLLAPSSPQEIQGIPAGAPRAPMPPASPEQQAAIRKCLEALEVRILG